jgi:osomolarity two-component system response regulator SKN7
MNDVLPKPFTKEGLLHMLEKHLVHLKKPMAQADGTMVAPQPVQIARQLVLKEEDSPAKSPQTVSNWNSPSQMPGVSPVGSTVPDDFAQAMRGQPVQHPSPYGVSSMHANMGYSTSPHMQMPPQQQPHRRQVSEISGGDEMNNPSKRQQMYPPQMQQQQQQQQMGSMQPRPR